MIDDSYNASPSSMKAALDVLGTVGYDTRGRLVAVLGDMLELGEKSAELHKALAAQIISKEVAVVVTSGALMKNLHDELPDTIEKAHVENVADITALLKEKTKRGDVVLLKGSHGSDIWQVADTLKSEGR
jgi:UDP-N-acetylmuramoyl-tripeptide--D-alanyl-D-alanine ligase